MHAALLSNVLISGAITRGPAHRIILQWLMSEPFELIICPALLEEVASVLIDRGRLRRWISIEELAFTSTD